MKTKSSTEPIWCIFSTSWAFYQQKISVFIKISQLLALKSSYSISGAWKLVRFLQQGSAVCAKLYFTYFLKLDHIDRISTLYFTLNIKTLKKWWDGVYKITFKILVFIKRCSCIGLLCRWAVAVLVLFYPSPWMEDLHGGNHLFLRLL